MMCVVPIPVGLEKTLIRGYEKNETVEVCVVVWSNSTDCPISFPFNVSLWTEDMDAGITNLVSGYILHVMSLDGYSLCVMMEVSLLQSLKRITMHIMAQSNLVDVIPGTV